MDNRDKNLFTLVKFNPIRSLSLLNNIAVIELIIIIEDSF